MIILLVSAISVFSLVFVFSEKENDFSGPRIVHNSTEVIPPGEYVPPDQERFPELMSHEEAVALADEFLTKTLGSEFFNTHFDRSSVFWYSGYCIL